MFAVASSFRKTKYAKTSVSPGGTLQVPEKLIAPELASHLLNAPLGVNTGV